MIYSITTHFSSPPPACSSRWWRKASSFSVLPFPGPLSTLFNLLLFGVFLKRKCVLGLFVFDVEPEAPHLQILDSGEGISSQGMGTKVHLKSYILIHNAIRNKNDHSSSSWSWYNQDNILSGHLYDGSVLREENGDSLCDKEMLKRMMLEHEATFTKQVSELHRLYRIQKELMTELKNREQPKLCSSFQTNLFTSHMLSEASEDLRQMPRLSAFGGHATAGNAIELPIKYLKESGTGCFQRPIRTAGSSIKGDFLDPKAISLPRKKFDLHLPAEVYIDIDDYTIMEKQNKPCLWVANPSSIAHNADDENNVKLSLRNKPVGSINGSSGQCIHTENVSSKVLADLNEPLKPSSYGEVEILTSQVNGATMDHEEIKEHQLQSNRSLLSRDFLLGNHGQKQTDFSFVNMDEGECLQGWPSSTHASGELRSTANGSHGGLCDGEFSVISQLVKEKPKNCSECVLPGQIKSDKWIGEKPCPGTETSKGTSKLPDLNSSELAVPQIPHSFANVSHSYNSSISSWRNPNGVKLITAAVQVLPGFNGYTVNTSRKADATFQSPCNPSDNVQYVVNSKQRFKGDLSSCQNGFHQDLTQDSISSVQTCPPLFISGKSSQRSCRDKVTLGDYNISADLKCSDDLYADVKQSLEPSWLRKMQEQHDPAGMEESTSQLMRLMSDPNAVTSSVNKMQNKEKCSTSVCSRVDSSSSLHIIERNEASCRPNNKRIFGFPISESTGQGVDCDFSSVHLRNQVNMFSSAPPCMDALNSIAALPKDELPSSLSTTNITMKTAPMIDLEGLLDTEEEKDIAAEEESKELNCDLSVVKITLNKEADLQQTVENHDALIREAGENLVAISLLIGSHSSNLTCPSIPTSSDSLYWFANFVTSTVVSSGISREKSSSYENDVDTLDVFEYMTLKLKEIKEDEFVCKPQENQNRDDTNMASLLLTKSGRGLARKRRRGRDFQKDILPGLASLSRHEVSEDLQNFGGIMKASGKSWKAFSSRNTSWKVPNCQAKGRQRHRSLAKTVAEINIGSSQKKAMHTKQVISTAGILGWGRTTRRCRRQRLVPGNLSVPLV